MRPEEFEEILGRLSGDELEQLEAAHWRYMALIELCEDCTEPEIIRADRAAFLQMIRRDADNRPIFKDEDCVAFMATVTGLGAQECEAWKDKDFYELHGFSVDDVFAVAEKGPVLL